MYNKKKEPDSKRHSSAKLTSGAKHHVRAAKYKIKSVKTSVATKPMFDPIAGP